MQLSVRIKVDTVQVNPSAVGAIVSPKHPIRVQHGNQLEDKVPAQCLRSWVVCPEKEVKQAIEDVTRRGFPWVYTAADENHLSSRM